MRYLLLVAMLMMGMGCEKDIKDVRLKPQPQLEPIESHA